MKASIQVQREVYKKCLELPQHNIKALASTQLADTDERKEVYKAYLEGWVFEDTPPPPIAKPTDEDVSRKYLSLIASARRRNKDFDLTLADVRKLLRVKKCQYTGMVMCIQQGEDASTWLPQGRTIDRLDPSKGYVKGNVYVVAHVANQIKNVLFEDSDSVVKINFKSMLTMMKKLDTMGFEIKEGVHA